MPHRRHPPARTPPGVADSPARPLVAAPASSSSSVVEILDNPDVDVVQQKRGLIQGRANILAQVEAGYTVEDVEGDGDCLFRAMALLRFGDQDAFQTDVRVATAQFAALHWGHYQDVVTETYAPHGGPLNIVDRQDFVRRFSVPMGIWAGVGEVQALANLLGVRIRTWMSDGQQTSHWPDFMHPDAVQEGFPEYNVYFTGNHYRSMFPRDVSPPHLRVKPRADLVAQAHSWQRAIAVVGVAWQSAEAGIRSTWYGHDMSIWPPSNRVHADSGLARTLSWLYMPIILSALRVYCPSFTFHRTPRFYSIRKAYRAEFRRKRITWESLQELGAVDGDLHLTAAWQEFLIGLLPVTAYEVLQYRNELETSQTEG